MYDYFYLYKIFKIKYNYILYLLKYVYDSLTTDLTLIYWDFI